MATLNRNFKSLPAFLAVLYGLALIAVCHADSGTPKHRHETGGERDVSLTASFSSTTESIEIPGLKSFLRQRLPLSNIDVDRDGGRRSQLREVERKTRSVRTEQRPWPRRRLTAVDEESVVRGQQETHELRDDLEIRQDAEDLTIVTLRPTPRNSLDYASRDAKRALVQNPFVQSKGAAKERADVALGRPEIEHIETDRASMELDSERLASRDARGVLRHPSTHRAKKRSAYNRVRSELERGEFRLTETARKTSMPLSSNESAIDLRHPATDRKSKASTYRRVRSHMSRSKTPKDSPVANELNERLTEADPTGDPVAVEQFDQLVPKVSSANRRRASQIDPRLRLSNTTAKKPSDSTAANTTKNWRTRKPSARPQSADSKPADSNSGARVAKNIKRRQRKPESTVESSSRPLRIANNTEKPCLNPASSSLTKRTETRHIATVSPLPEPPSSLSLSNNSASTEAFADGTRRIAIGDPALDSFYNSHVHGHASGQHFSGDIATIQGTDSSCVNGSCLDGSCLADSNPSGNAAGFSVPLASCNYFYAYTDKMYVYRSGGESGDATRDDGDFAAEFDDFEIADRYAIGWESGSSNWGVDASFWRVDEWGRTRTADGNLTVVGVDIGTGDSRARYESDLKSVELNLTHYLTNWTQLGIGARWMNLDEFAFATGSGNLVANLDRRVKMRNELMGGQVFARHVLFDHGGDFKVNLRLNFGVFGNDIDRTLVNFGTAQLSDSTTSLMLETEIGGEYYLTDNAFLRFGYQFNWISELGLAIDQFFDENSIRNDSDLFLHGLYLGGGWAW